MRASRLATDLATSSIVDFVTCTNVISNCRIKVKVGCQLGDTKDVTQCDVEPNIAAWRDDAVPLAMDAPRIEGSLSHNEY